MTTRAGDKIDELWRCVHHSPCKTLYDLLLLRCVLGCRCRVAFVPHITSGAATGIASASRGPSQRSWT